MANHYVDPSGNDSNPGTEAKPWLATGAVLIVNPTIAQVHGLAILDLNAGSLSLNEPPLNGYFGELRGSASVQGLTNISNVSGPSSREGASSQSNFALVSG